MQKLIIKNKYQSLNRMNILTAAGIAQINEPITPQNGERIFGGLGVVTFNQASQYNEEENPNDPITPPNCPNCGGGIKPEPSVSPGANCDKKNISELKQILDDYANQSFCDKEFPEVQFSTFIGYDKPPSDSTAKEIELRMLCPSDECLTNKAMTDNIATGGNACDGEVISTFFDYVTPCETDPHVFLFKKEPSCDLCREMNMSGLQKVIEKLNIQGACGDNSFYGFEIRFWRPALFPTVTIEGMPDAETIYSILESGDKSGQIQLVYRRPDGQLTIDGCGFACSQSGSIFPSGFNFNIDCSHNIYQFEDNCSYLTYLRPFCEN